MQGKYVIHVMHVSYSASALSSLGLGCIRTETTEGGTIVLDKKQTS